MIKQALICCAALSALSLGACDTYGAQPLPYFATASRPLTAESVAYQHDEVHPRCKMVAKETTPSPIKNGAVYGITGAVVGGGANAGATAAEAAILGGRLAAHALPAVGAAAAITTGAAMATSGVYASYSIRRSKAENCVAEDAVGLYQVAPSIAAKVAKGEKAPTYGYSSYRRENGTSAAAGTAAALPPLPPLD